MWNVIRWQRAFFRLCCLAAASLILAGSTGVFAATTHHSRLSKVPAKFHQASSLEEVLLQGSRRGRRGKLERQKGTLNLETYGTEANCAGDSSKCAADETCVTFREATNGGDDSISVFRCVQTVKTNNLCLRTNRQSNFGYCPEGRLCKNHLDQEMQCNPGPDCLYGYNPIKLVDRCNTTFEACFARGCGAGGSGCPSGYTCRATAAGQVCASQSLPVLCPVVPTTAKPEVATEAPTTTSPPIVPTSSAPSTVPVTAAAPTTSTAVTTTAPTHSTGPHSPTATTGHPTTPSTPAEDKDKNTKTTKNNAVGTSAGRSWLQSPSQLNVVMTMLLATVLGLAWM